MREYAFHASDATIAALRRLRAAWAGWSVAPDRLTVRLADGAVYHLTSEGADMEPTLEAFRIAAGLAEQEVDARGGAGERPAGDFAAGGKDVVVFHGVTWTEPGTGDAAGQTLQFSGRLGLQPEGAEAACVTTDAVVFATGTGEGILVRLGARPGSIEVVTDRGEIGRFLVQRGYSAG